MPAEIITVGFCPQYNATFRVHGSRGAEYFVHLYPEGADCMCPAFKYSGQDRTCKHVTLIWEHGCLYNPQWKDPGPNDLSEHGITMLSSDGGLDPCPGCGGKMIPVKIAV